MSRKVFPISLRAAIWRAHERRCIYCTEPLEFADLDLDHIIPIHLTSEPSQLSKLLNDYGLSDNFEIDGPLNIVPSHRRCNLQKKGNILPINRILHFLSIAEEKFSKVKQIDFELREQVKKDNLAILLQVALIEGRINPMELNFIINNYYTKNNVHEMLMPLYFVDSKLNRFISSTDIESLYDRNILPNPNGLDELTMVKAILNKKKKIRVRNCRKWVQAVRNGYYAVSTYDIKAEMYFKQIYAIIIALSQSQIPKYKYISDTKSSVANFNLLPLTLLPVLSNDNNVELHQFISKGFTITDLIAKNKIKIISSLPLSLTLHYKGMGLSLNEILRSDLNNDGIEDILVSIYEWTRKGTFGAGSNVVLTRLGIDQPFTLAENIELSVKEISE